MRFLCTFINWVCFLSVLKLLAFLIFRLFKGKKLLIKAEYLFYNIAKFGGLDSYLQIMPAGNFQSLLKFLESRNKSQFKRRRNVT